MEGTGKMPFDFLSLGAELQVRTACSPKEQPGHNSLSICEKDEK